MSKTQVLLGTLDKPKLKTLRRSPKDRLTDTSGVSRISGKNLERLLTTGAECDVILRSRGALPLCSPQSVKERQFSLCESWRFSRIKEEIGQKNKEIRAAPLPEGQFFEIHSSIFKPHPC